MVGVVGDALVVEASHHGVVDGLCLGDDDDDDDDGDDDDVEVTAHQGRDDVVAFRFVVIGFPRVVVVVVVFLDEAVVDEC